MSFDKSGLKLEFAVETTMGRASYLSSTTIADKNKLERRDLLLFGGHDV